MDILKNEQEQFSNLMISNGMRWRHIMTECNREPRAMALPCLTFVEWAESFSFLGFLLGSHNACHCHHMTQWCLEGAGRGHRVMNPRCSFSPWEKPWAGGGGGGGGKRPLLLAPAILVALVSRRRWRGKEHAAVANSNLRCCCSPCCWCCCMLLLTSDMLLQQLLLVALLVAPLGGAPTSPAPPPGLEEEGRRQAETKLRLTGPIVAPLTRVELFQRPRPRYVVAIVVALLWSAALMIGQFSIQNLQMLVLETTPK